MPVLRLCIGPAIETLRFTLHICHRQCLWRKIWLCSKFSEIMHFSQKLYILLPNWYVSCGKKLSHKFCPWRKMTNMRYAEIRCCVSSFCDLHSRHLLLNPRTPIQLSVIFSFDFLVLLKIRKVQNFCLQEKSSDKFCSPTESFLYLIFQAET